MKIKAVLLLTLLLFGNLLAAQLKDVQYGCNSKSCKLGFQFDTGENLPGFFQKYDPNSKILTVAFSETAKDFIVGVFTVGDDSQQIRRVKVYEDKKLLKFDFYVNDEIQGEKHPAGLSGKSIFEITLPIAKSTAKAWSLQEIIKVSQKVEEKPVEKTKPQTEKQVSAPIPEKAPEVLKTPSPEKKEEIKVEEQKVVEVKVEEKPSVLIPGIREMNALKGMGFSQFRLMTDSLIRPDQLKFGKSELLIALSGPEKSPVFNVNENVLVKSLVWTKNGLKIQFHPQAVPFAMISDDGALILQMAEKKSSSKWTYWKALPEGIQRNSWGVPPSLKIGNLETFMGKYKEDKIVSVAESFHLRPTPKELIVVANEASLLTAPNEEAPVSYRFVFGDRLISLELEGLYYRVKVGNKTGYINRRAVSFRDELSAVQTERLKQLALERGDVLDSQTVRLETVFDDRITYSSYGRRDPFVEITGLVGEGINVDQVELVGIIWEPEVPMAILVETKNPTISYTVKEGDKILNGKVLKITQTDVLFLIQEFGVNRRFSMGLPDKYGGK